MLVSIGICFFFAPLKAHAYYGQGKTIILQGGVKILPNGNVVTPPPPTPAAVAAQRKYYQDLDKTRKEKSRKYNLLAAYIRSDWTADDAPYASLRKEIEKEYLGSPDPKGVYERICAKYSRSSDHDFFARLLAAELYGYDGHLEITWDKLLVPYIEYACNRTDSSNPLPHSYNFQRVVLIASRLDFNVGIIARNSGERYYQKDPDDFLTSYVYAYELTNPQFSPLMEVLKKKYPGNPYLLNLESGYYSSLGYGCVYERHEFKSQGSTPLRNPYVPKPHPDLQQALRYYQLSLAIAQAAYNNTVGWPSETRKFYASMVDLAKQDISDTEIQIRDAAKHGR
jgi:hypothetical protein